GLGAILEEVEEAYIGNIDEATIVRDISVNRIDPNPYQPRKHFDEESLAELAHSIKEHGLIQPIVVIKRDNRFILLAGERRLRASKLAKLSTVKAIVADIQEQKMRELALIENIQRENLNPIDLAGSLKELIEQYDITHEALADVLKKSRSYVTNTLRLLTLDSYVQDKILNSELSYGHAKVLVGLPVSEQKKLADTINGQKLSVRETEQLVANVKKGEPNNTSLDLSLAKHTLEKLTNAKITTRSSSLNIVFSNQSELIEFCNKLQKIV
ncbi:MAG: chromosome partitioning protein, partial [Pseudomonadota bacterium]